MGEMDMAKQTPLSFFEFQRKFNTEEACREHLFNLRWPNGFICPKCGNPTCYSLKTRHVHECKKCHYQASVTSGTVMDKTRVPLQKWFWAIYFMSTDKRGHSALQLQKELEVGYKTAWYMLQRIRTGMLEKDWDYKLSNIVETDEAFFGAPTRGGKRGRGTEKTKVIVGVSLDNDGRPMYAKMETSKKLDADAINAFAENNIEEGAIVRSDGSTSYPQLTQKGYKHVGISNSKADKQHLKWLHTIISNAKAFFEGTFHGLDEKHMDLYLAEFCFRFNRRFWPGQLFNRLVFACLRSPKIPYAELTL
jgi:transposase-like protein